MARDSKKHLARWGTGVKKTNNLIYYGVLSVANFQFAIFNRMGDNASGWAVFNMAVGMMCLIMFFLVGLKMEQD